MCSVGLCTAIAIAMLDAHTYNRTVELLGDVQRKGQPAGIPLERTNRRILQYVCRLLPVTTDVITIDALNNFAKVFIANLFIVT